MVGYGYMTYVSNKGGSSVYKPHQLVQYIYDKPNLFKPMLAYGTVYLLTLHNGNPQNDRTC